MKKGHWITVFLAVAAAGFLWCIAGVQTESGAIARMPHPKAAPLEPEPLARDLSTDGERSPLIPQPSAIEHDSLSPSPVIIPEQPLPRSPLARDLYDVAASFLTELPRVTDLLGLVEHLASLAVVNAASVKIQRNEIGELMSAGGRLAIGDLPGTFHIDKDGFVVEFDMALKDGPWSRCSFQISFQGGDSGARGCNSTVQFHLEDGEEAANHQGELLIGWAVGTAGEKGALAHPLTMTFDGDSWQIGGSGRVQPQEFPWILSHTGGFDAWLRALKAWTSG